MTEIIRGKTQTTAIATTYTHLLISRCLNGRNVAWNRSKETAAMFVRETKGKKKSKLDNKSPTSRDKFNFIRRHCRRRLNWTWPTHRTPTNISATVKLIIKYMLRVPRRLFFIKRRMERRFTVTIATNSAVNTVNQMIHSTDDETIMLSYFRRCVTPNREPVRTIYKLWSV